MITGCLTGGKKLSFSRLTGTIYGYDADLWPGISPIHEGLSQHIRT